MIRPADVVRHRLAGGNSHQELAFVAQEAASQFRRDQAKDLADNTDYWLGAWLAAACAKPLDYEQTKWLTMAMAESGSVIDVSSLPHPVVDKHSTGGVGDKTTLIILPILASCGLSCLKMSGKGLGHTGGTIDKLASVPGFRTDLTVDQMVETCRQCGIALAEQGQDLAPADGKLYQLRDLTGTVASLPLIVASILSKKIAGGANLVGLDVKCGSGALMTDLQHATELAEWLVRVGRESGLQIHAAVTDMDQPLGRAVGNALEVKEAAAVLRREGEPRLTQLCLTLARDTLHHAGQNPDLADQALASGRALHKAEQWFEAQGGDPTCLHHNDWQKSAATTVIFSPNGGFIQKVDARAVGESAVKLGAGRTTKTDVIDPTVGIEVLVQPGDKIDPGQPVFTVHHRAELSTEVVRALQQSIVTAEAPPPPRPLVFTTV